MKESAFSFQGAYAGFVYTYGVSSPMSLPHKTAGYLASIFWGAITVGRLLSIPLSYRFQPVRLLMFNIVRPIKYLECHHVMIETNTMKLKSQTHSDINTKYSLCVYRQVLSLLCWCCLFSTPVASFCLSGPVYVGFSSAAYSPVCLPILKTSLIIRVSWSF